MVTGQRYVILIQIFFWHVLGIILNCLNAEIFNVMHLQSSVTKVLLSNIYKDYVVTRIHTDQPQ